VGVHFAEKVEDKQKKASAMVSEGSNNGTTFYQKSKHIYNFTDNLHCLINTVTALLELLTDCSIRVKGATFPLPFSGLIIKG